MIRLLALLFLLPGSALACACCAEKGDRFEYDVALDDYEKGKLGDAYLKGPVFLFQTACGMECVKGITDPQDSYAAKLSFEKDALIFVLEGGGAIFFHLPDHYRYFGVDTDPLAEGYTANLYTEMRFQGRIDGTFDFARRGTAELVISGWGNLCNGPQNYEHWSLSVSGEGVDYRLYGGIGLDDEQ